MSGSPCIIVHCGVELERNYPLTMERVASCRKSACIGYEKLRNGASAVEAVEAALRWLEDDELFNCGYGSVVQRLVPDSIARGEHLTRLVVRGLGQEAQVPRVQMDATIVDGRSQRCGSVLGIDRFDHPISLARRALQSAPNAILSSDGLKLARDSDALLEGAQRGSRAWAAESALSPGALPGVAGALGCIAWDGAAMAAGSTSGGPQAGASLLGSGVHADALSGCSLTCHGDAPLPRGLARRAGDFRSLRRALDGLATPAGAVRLLADGSYLLHHTGQRMPFAHVAKDGSVTCGPALAARSAE